MLKKRISPTVLALGLALIMLSGFLPATVNGSFAMAAKSPLQCQKYIRFMDADDPHNTDCSPSFPRRRQINWTTAARAKIEKAVVLIMQKSPGLLERAGNGEKITIRLFSGEGTAAETDPCQMAVYTNLLRAPAKFIAETLAHEMVHLIDYGSNLSNSKEWNRLIAPLLAKYRSEFPDPDLLDQPRTLARAEKRLKQLQIPNDYAAETPSEALAEYTAVIALSDFSAPGGIRQFIQAQILSRPKSVNQNSKAMKSACQSLNRGDHQAAIAGFKKLLEVAPDYSLAYWYLGTACWQSNKLTAAATNLKRSLEIMQQNNVPDYSDDLQRVCSLLNNVENDLQKRTRFRQQLSTSKSAASKNVRGRK